MTVLARRLMASPLRLRQVAVSMLGALALLAAFAGTSFAAAPSAPVLAAASDTGASQIDGITSLTTGLTFTGTANPNASITLWNGATQIGSGVADASGNYAITTSVAIPANATSTITAIDGYTIQTPAARQSVSKGSGTGSATSSAPVFGSSTVAGDTLVAVLTESSAWGIYTPTAPAGWTLITNYNQGNAAAWMWVYPNAPAMTSAGTWSWGTSIGYSLMLVDYSGVNGTLRTVSGPFYNGTITPSVGPINNPYGANALFVAGVGDYNGGLGPLSSTSSFTMRAQNINNYSPSYYYSSGQMLDLVSGAASATANVSQMNSVSQPYYAGLGVAFAPVMSGTTSAGTTIKTDTVAPTSAASTLSTYKTSRTISIPYSSSDATSGVASVALYYATSSLTSINAYTFAGTYTASPITFSAPSDGPFYFYTVATDVAGNVESLPASFDATTIVDTAAPSSTVGAMPAWSTSRTLSLPWTASDPAPASGVANVKLYYATSPATAIAVYTLIGTYTASPIAWTAPSDGAFYFYTLATDNAGNAEPLPAAYDATISVDTVAPATPSAPLLAAANDTGYSSTDGITTQQGPGLVFAGTAEANSTVNLYVGGTTLIGTATASAGGAYAVTSSVALSINASSLITAKATDAAGNTSAASAATTIVVDQTAPTSSVSALSAYKTSRSLSLAYTASDTGGAGVYQTSIYYATSASTPIGSYTLAGTYAVSPAAWTAPSDGQFWFYAVATDKAGNVQALPGTFNTATTVDTVAPTAAFTNPTTAITEQSAAPFTWSWTESDATSGVASRSTQLYYGVPSAIDSCASTSWSAYGAAQTAASPRTDSLPYVNYCFRLGVTLTDAAGNVAVAFSNPVLYDTETPVAPTIAAAGANTYKSGNTVYINATMAGSLTLTATETNLTYVSTNATRFGALSDATGWTYTSTTVSGNPANATLSWVAGAHSATIAINGVTAAGTNGATITITLTPDATAPAVAFTMPTAAITYIASSSYAPAWSETETGSGIATRSRQQQKAAVLTPGSCDGLTYAPDGAPSSATSGTSITGLLSGYCYTWIETLTDRVGNTANTTSNPVLVDTTTPSAPAVTVSGTGASMTGSTLYIRTTLAGNLTLTSTGSATPSSAPSGIASSTFGALSATTGWTYTSGTVTGNPATKGMSWATNAVVATLPVTTKDNAGTTSATNTLTITLDNTGPVVTPAALPTYSLSGSVTFTWTESDAGAGINAASRAIQRQKGAIVTPGTCTGATGWANDGIATSGASPLVDSGLASGFCYRYLVTLSDLVGNASSVTSTPVLVDTSVPVSAVGTIPAYTTSRSLSLPYTASDPDAGTLAIKIYEATSAAGPYVQIGTPTSSPYAWTAPSDGTFYFYSIATDPDGNIEATPLSPDASIIVDTTAPSVPVFTAPSGTVQGGMSATFAWNASADAGSGVAGYQVATQTASYANDACGAWTPQSAWSATQIGTSFSMSVPGATCAEISVRALDVAGNISAQATSLPWKTDVIAPVIASVTLAGPNGSTSAANGPVTITIAASDTGGSKLAQMRFSNDGTTWSTWEAYSATRTGWALAAPDGPKTVSVEVSDGANTSAPVNASILLDTVAPLIGNVLPNTFAITNQTSVTVSWSETETGSGVTNRTLQRRQAAISAPNTCSSTWSDAGSPIALAGPIYSATLPTGVCSLYRITISDAAGNVSASVDTAPVLVDTAGEVIYSASTSVWTDTGLPSLSFTDFLGKGPSWNGDVVTVPYIATDPLDVADANASYSSGAWKVDVMGGPQNGPAEDLTPPGEPSSAAIAYATSNADATYVFTMTATDVAGNTFTKSITVDRPQVKITSPVSFGYVNQTAATAYTVTWTEKSSTNVNRTVVRQIAGPVGATGTCPAASDPSWTDTEPQVNDPNSAVEPTNSTVKTFPTTVGECDRWVVSITNNQGITASDTSAAVFVDTVAPTVSFGLSATNQGSVTVIGNDQGGSGVSAVFAEPGDSPMTQAPDGTWTLPSSASPDGVLSARAVDRAGNSGSATSPTMPTTSSSALEAGVLIFDCTDGGNRQVVTRNTTGTITWPVDRPLCVIPYGVGTVRDAQTGATGHLPEDPGAGSSYELLGDDTVLSPIDGTTKISQMNPGALGDGPYLGIGNRDDRQANTDYWLAQALPATSTSANSAMLDGGIVKVGVDTFLATAKSRILRIDLLRETADRPDRLPSLEIPFLIETPVNWTDANGNPLAPTQAVYRLTLQIIAKNAGVAP